MNVLYDLYFISHFFSALTSIAIVIPTFRIFLHTKIRMILLMTVLGITWGTVHIVTVLPYFTNILSTNIVSALFSVGTMVVICLLVIFMDIFDGKLSFRKNILVFSGLSGVVFLVLAGLMNKSPEIYALKVTIPETSFELFLFSPLITIIIFFTAFVGGIWIFLTINNSLQLAIDIRQVNQLKLMRLGLLFLVFTSLCFTWCNVWLS